LKKNFKLLGPTWGVMAIILTVSPNIDPIKMSTQIVNILSYYVS